jgi:hypothetical protein
MEKLMLDLGKAPTTNSGTELISPRPPNKPHFKNVTVLNSSSTVYLILMTTSLTLVQEYISDVVMSTM